MNKTHRITALIMVFIILTCTCACSTKKQPKTEVVSPPRILEDFIKAMNAGDFDSACKLTVDDSLKKRINPDISDISSDAMGDLFPDVKVDKLMTAMLEFESMAYREYVKYIRIENPGEAEIDGESAKMEVTVVEPDIGKVLDKLFSNDSEMMNMFVEELEAEESGQTEDYYLKSANEMLDRMQTFFKEAFSSPDCPMREEKTQVTFTKSGDLWLISGENENKEFYDLIMGIDKNDALDKETLDSIFADEDIF